MALPKLTTLRAGPRVIACLIAGALLCPGCVTNGYRRARADTPAPAPLNVRFDPGRLNAELNVLITYNSPGSWKRDALWDEYTSSRSKTMAVSRSQSPRRHSSIPWGRREPPVITRGHWRRRAGPWNTSTGLRE